MSKIVLVGPSTCPDPHINLPNFVNTTSISKSFGKGLSPFFLGPVPLYDGAPTKLSFIVENVWQYSKIYPEYDNNGTPSENFFEWSKNGYLLRHANKYPLGKNKKPLYFWWGEKLEYIEARKKIYLPTYWNKVKTTQAFEKLKEIYNNNETIYLWDFNSYSSEELNMGFESLLDYDQKTMGHSLILAMGLEGYLC
jgi:hypothetical protein